MSVVEGIPEIEVTPAMIAAGMKELREHSYGEDIRFVLESVYRAMAYAALAAEDPEPRL